MRLVFRPADDRIRVFLCGDSTMVTKLLIDNLQTGWGMSSPPIELQNHAINGRSTKGFVAYPKSAQRLLKLSGDRNRAIRILNTPLPGLKTMVELVDRVPKEAFQNR